MLTISSIFRLSLSLCRFLPAGTQVVHQKAPAHTFWTHSHTSHVCMPSCYSMCGLAVFFYCTHLCGKASHLMASPVFVASLSGFDILCQVYVFNPPADKLMDETLGHSARADGLSQKEPSGWWNKDNGHYLLTTWRNCRMSSDPLRQVRSGRGQGKLCCAKSRECVNVSGINQQAFGGLCNRSFEELQIGSAVHKDKVVPPHWWTPLLASSPQRQSRQRNLFGAFVCLLKQKN